MALLESQLAKEKENSKKLSKELEAIKLEPDLLNKSTPIAIDFDKIYENQMPKVRNQNPYGTTMKIKPPPRPMSSTGVRMNAMTP